MARSTDHEVRHMPVIRRRRFLCFNNLLVLTYMSSVVWKQGDPGGQFFSGNESAYYDREMRYWNCVVSESGCGGPCLRIN